MQEYKFRGKTENNTWKFGSLLTDIPQKSYYIVDNEDGSGREVIPETIGQYTGITDINKVEIYTGDIVKSGEAIGLVVFDEHFLGYFVNFEEQEPLYNVYIEKIGNIHDNPEMLEGGLAMNKTGCTHNWIHNAGKQCKWDEWSLEDSIKGTKPEEYRKDSNNICYFYICTMCGEEIWSSEKLFNIPHYRVRERRKHKK